MYFQSNLHISFFKYASTLSKNKIYHGLFTNLKAFITRRTERSLFKRHRKCIKPIKKFKHHCTISDKFVFKDLVTEGYGKSQSERKIDSLKMQYKGFFREQKHMYYISTSA